MGRRERHNASHFVLLNQRRRDMVKCSRDDHCVKRTTFFDPNDARRQAWNGKWPGEDDCERLGVKRCLIQH
jgi:hypothetical protein